MNLSKAIGLAGELLIITGLIVASYLVYATFWSNVKSDEIAAQISSELEQEFASSKSEILESPGLAKDLGGLALLYIPALGNDVMGVPILDGVTDRQLAAGVGRYLDSEEPGEAGNLTLAGHRATNGEPFARFELLQAGDLVYIRNKEGWFVYRLVANQKIAKTEVWVIGDQPEVMELSSDRLITLTTCDPRWNSTRRWAWWGEFEYFSSTSPLQIGVR